MAAALQTPEPSEEFVRELSRFGSGDSIRTARYRYSVYRNRKGTMTGHMLYDHDTDPGENINVADDPACEDVVADLAKRLQAGMGKPGVLR